MGVQPPTQSHGERTAQEGGNNGPEVVMARGEDIAKIVTSVLQQLGVTGPSAVKMQRRRRKVMVEKFSENQEARLDQLVCLSICE
jgi:hypothetical protein